MIFFAGAGFPALVLFPDSYSFPGSLGITASAHAEGRKTPTAPEGWAAAKVESPGDASDTLDSNSGGGSTNSGKKSGKAETSGGGGGRGRAHKASAEGRSRQAQPKTLVDLFKRMFSEGEKPPARSSAGATAKPSPRPRPSASDVLAINLSDEAASVVTKLGFKVAQRTQLANLGVSVAEISPPEGMDAEKASEYLSSQLPGEDFALNHSYRPYQAATGHHEPPEGVIDAGPRRASKQEACIPREHCYGSSMIRWNADVQSCAKGVKVGVIDTGVDLDHPTFSEHKVIVTHTLPDGRVPAGNWHGTGVLALLAGDPLSGTPGLIPDAKIYMADVFFADSEGFPISNTAAMLRALNLMEQYEVQVVNLSVSGPEDKNVRKAIERMSKNGVIFVAAAGNEGPAGQAAYPAAYPQVIAVTAVDNELRSYRYANRGPYISVSAPGVRIWTALPNAKEGYQSGTSFAAPYVTAVAAATYPLVPGKRADKHKESLMNLFHYRASSEPDAANVYGKGLIVAPDVIIGPDGKCSLKALTSATARSAATPVQPPPAASPPRPAPLPAHRMKPAGN